MPFVPAPQTCMAELRYQYSTQRCENTLYFQGSAAMTTTLMTSIGTALATWWTNNFRPLVSNQLSLTEVFMTDLTTATAPTVSVVTGLPSVGTDIVEAMPFNVSYCISFRTNGRGRSARGRNYIVGLTEADVIGNTIDLGFRNSALAAYQILLGAGTFVPGCIWAVVSRFANKVERAVALVQPITAVVAVDTIIDSQRRRLPGRGK